MLPAARTPFSRTLLAVALAKGQPPAPAGAAGGGDQGEQPAVVARDDPDDVTLGEPVFVQLVGDRVGPGVELGVGQAPRLVDDRELIRVLQRVLLDHRCDRADLLTKLCQFHGPLGLAQVEYSRALQYLHGTDEIGDLLERVPQRGHDTYSF